MTQTRDITERLDGAAANADAMRDHFAGLRENLNALLADCGRFASARYRATTRRFTLMRESAIDTVDSGTRLVSGQIRQRPLSAFGLSAGLGLLIGMVLSRRR